MPRLLWPSWRWMTMSGTPSRAISTAWAWRSWCGATRRRTPAVAAVRRSSRGGGRPWSSSGRAVDDAEQRADGELEAPIDPTLQVLPRPLVHTDLAPAPAFAAAHEQGPATVVEV